MFGYLDGIYLGLVVPMSLYCIYFPDVFGLTNVSANVSAALCAVVMLHIALGMYIFKAYSKPSEVPEKPAKQD